MKKIIKLIIQIPLKIITIPFLIIFPPLGLKLLLPNGYKKMRELTKKQFEIEKAKIEKEYKKLKNEKD